MATRTHTNGNEAANRYVSGTRFNFYEDTTQVYEEEKPVIHYTPASLTNQDVTATLELPSGFTAVGDTTHTFQTNGEHLFTYRNLYGEERQITAAVNWIDKVPPTAEVQYEVTAVARLSYSMLTLSPAAFSPTNQNVTATLVKESENITVTNNSGSKSHLFTANGSFDFQIRDDAGNTNTITATVDWIDKTAPTAKVKYSTESLTNQNVVATLAEESEDITVVNNNHSREYTFTKNGKFTFQIQDKAGNTAEITAEVDWIDKDAPTAKVQYSIDTLTNQDVTATLVEESEAFTVTNNNGSKSHTFTENDSFTFEIVDKAGNTAQITAKVDWIDKVPPTAKVEYSTTDPTNQNVTATLVEESEAFTVKNNNGSKSHTFTENDSFTFEIVDQAGNTNQITATVDWIDRTAPTAAVEYSTTSPTNQNVTATLVNTGGKDYTITNNGGSAQYTFTQNGSFTFEIVDKAGNTNQITATVDWIDRTGTTAGGESM